METIAPGITAEEEKDSARIAVVFYPRLGKWMFFIFLAFYAWFMYSFTQPGSFDSYHLMETLAGYGLFLLLFSPMLYLAFFLWKAKTVIELRAHQLRMYYSLPAWFGKKIKLPLQPQPIRVREFSVVNKGNTTRYHMLHFAHEAAQVDFTYFYFPDQAEAVAQYLTAQWLRISGQSAASNGGRRSDS